MRWLNTPAPGVGGVVKPIGLPQHIPIGLYRLVRVRRRMPCAPKETNVHACDPMAAVPCSTRVTLRSIKAELQPVQTHLHSI